MTLREFAINHRLHPLNGSRKLNVPFGCEKQHIAKKTFAFFSTEKHDTDACSPSRGAMLTSTYPQENGVLHTIGTPPSVNTKTDARNESDPPIGFTQDALRPNMLNLAHMLKAAGYQVFWKGKWHLSHPTNGTDN
jgi:arylsulfatase A-like enzyme